MRRNKQYRLPKNWDWVPFGECAQLVNGRAYAQDELLDQGTPVLRIQNLNGGDRWYYSNLNLPAEKYCESGDLLFAWSATFGPYRWIGPKSIYHYHIWKVLPKNNLDKAFAFRLLERISQEIKSAAHGVTMVHMTKSGMEEWKIPLPPIAEQKRIAAILDKAEELRGLRRKALEELDAIVQSIFLEMFGDPLTNPKNWERKSIKQIGRVITGNTPPRAQPELYGSAIEWIKSDNINTPHNYLTKATEGLSEVGKAVARTVPASSILVTCIAGTPDCIGNAAIADREVAFNQQINALVPEIGDFRFLYTQILVNKRLIQEASTSSMKGMVSKSRFEEIQFIFPPIEMQQDFGESFEKIEQLKATHRESLVQLDALFASLQHRAFRGEL